MVSWITRVRCSFHGHWWVIANIDIHPPHGNTQVTYYCGRDCGAEKTVIYSGPKPSPPPT